MNFLKIKRLCKAIVPENFRKLTGKQLQWSLSFNRVAGPGLGICGCHLDGCICWYDGGDMKLNKCGECNSKRTSFAQSTSTCSKSTKKH